MESTPQHLPRLFIVILNSSRRDDTLACLASLAENAYPNKTVCVLDNASTDGSVEAIRQQFPDVILHSLAGNTGYAGNNNIGIQIALSTNAEWVLVLNEDTVLAPDCLARMMECAASDNRIGIVGPLVYHHDEPEVIQSAGGYLDKYMRPSHIGQNQPDEGQFDSRREVDWISGCAICVRADAIRQAGTLDATYFYYWEETEWCIRIAAAEWRVVLEPAAKLWHKGVQRNYNPGPNVAYYNTRNRLLTLFRHRAHLSAWAVAYAEIGRTLTSMTLRPKWRDKHQSRDAIWEGLLDYHRGKLGKREESRG